MSRSLPLAYLDLPRPDRQIAYRYSAPRSPFSTVVFLCGFRSDMNGEKVQFLEAWCQAEGIGFLAFDYSGHGMSSGRFEDGTLSQWLADSLGVVDSLTQGPLIVVGSSMGGWLAFLVALQRPQRVVGVMGIASAPDFTQELMWRKFTQAQQTEVMRQGWTIIPTPYNDRGWIITRRLIEDGRTHLLLGKEIPLSLPIRLVHGMRDVDVPASYSHRLMEAVISEDVALTLIKGGDHRLSRPQDLEILQEGLRGLVKAVIP